MPWCVQHDPVVAFGQGEEVLVLRHAQVGDDQPKPGVAGEQGRDRGGAGVRAGRRAGAAVRHHRDSCFGQQPPDLLQDRVTRVEAADLEMALEHPRSLVQCPAEVAVGVTSIDKNCVNLLFGPACVHRCKFVVRQ